MALLSGRLPIHNGVLMRGPDRWDGGTDPNSGYDGLSPNVTTMVAKLNHTTGPCNDGSSGLCCAPLFADDPCCLPGQRPDTANILAPLPPLPQDCGQGCLFELTSDPTESVNLATTRPLDLLRLQSLIVAGNATYYEPFRGCPVLNLLCSVTKGYYNFTYGPFVNVPGCSECAVAGVTPTRRTSNECQCFATKSECELDTLCVWQGGANLLPLYQCDLPPGVTRYQRIADIAWRGADNWGAVFG